MPTLITHTLIGLATTASLPRPPRRFWLLAIIAAALPDLDVAGFYLGVPYASTFGHRGFFHSLSFALLLGLTLALLFMRKQSASMPVRIGYGLLLTLIAASHGIADAFTNGGLGVALLSPFDQHRYFFETTPIAVSPLHPKHFLSGRMTTVLISEMRYVGLPLLGVVLCSRLASRALLWCRKSTVEVTK